MALVIMTPSLIEVGRLTASERLAKHLAASFPRLDRRRRALRRMIFNGRRPDEAGCDKTRKEVGPLNACRISLLVSPFSQIRQEKFPASRRREFRRNRLIWREFLMHLKADSLQIAKNSLQIPVYQGILLRRPVRSGLHPPPRSHVLPEIS
jgi:hypothetical protein